MKRIKRRHLLAAMLLTMLAAPAQAEPGRITLQLKWTHQFQFAGYYAAIEQGYYREAGLNVRLREAAPGINPVQAVTNGDAEYGVGTTDLLLDRARGIPVVVLGVIFQHSPYALIVHADSNIRHVKDLRGKRIMLEANSADIVAMLQRAGVLPGSYQQVEHNFKLDDWIQGKVDASSIYITDEPYDLLRQGIAYRVFRPITSGVDFYGDNLFTSEQEIRNHPQRTRAFLDASMKGWDYAMHHPDEIIDLILRKYHSHQSRDQLRFEANAMRPLLQHETVPAGYMFDSRWREIVSTYQALGALPADFTLQGFLYQSQADVLSELWGWRWQILVGILILVLVMIATFVVFLRKLVNQRTAELQQSKQEADQANVSKSRLLAAASHDMRQPMQAMRLYLDVLAGRLEPNHQDIIAKFQLAHADLSGLLDRCLDISRMDTGSLSPQPEIFHLNTLLHQLHEQYQPLASAAGLTFQMHLPAREIRVNSDPWFVKRILSNLISNAIRYTQRGGILLSARQHGSAMRLEVCDNGPGIEESKQQLIFQDFVQLAEAGHERQQGVGLGLAIVSRMCRLLGDRIRLQSRPGRGSVFSFDVPLALNPVQEQENHTVAQEQSVSLSGRLVFVIDDEPRIRDGLALILEQWQCRVMSFADQQTALEAMERMPEIPDAIIADQHLANEKTGVAAIQQLQAAAGKAIPALLLTGDTNPARMEEALDAGFPLLNKPVEAFRLRLFLESG